MTLLDHVTLATMSRLTVTVEQDHLERLVKKPLTGLAELIWNSLDADATDIAVEVEVNDWDVIDQVKVIDNGTGITPERAESDFGHLGGSWKRMATTTVAGRAPHGSAGQGRWAAYGVGEVIRWSSVADRITGERSRIVIVGRRGSLREFEVSDPESVEAGTLTGTVVTVEQLNEQTQRALDRDGVAETLTAVFALYLEQYPVRITWRSKPLDSQKLQRIRHDAVLTVEGVDGTIQLTIIEWTRPVERALHLCDASGVALAEIPPGVQAPGFEFTAYIRWAGFRAVQTELVLGEMAQEPVSEIIEAAKQELRDYFRERATERGTELVREWKAERSYPYHSEPTNAVERAERDLFDIVAVTAAPVVEPADQRSRALSLRLLREAVEKSPGTVHEVLQEVLDLPQDRLEELRQLMGRSSLSAIIAAARQITDRLDFLVGLEEVIFDRELRQHVLERSQLHRMLANETWVFREEYALTADDVTLKTALRSHIGLLGRNELAPEDVEASDVLDENGRRIVVDMMLSRVVEQRRNHREHIVIELKRPNVHIGPDQVMQIQNYATAVARDPRFAMTDARWEFWIVGDELTDSVTLMADQRNREAGIVVDAQQGGFVVRAVTWGQIIQDARHRLSFVRNALEYNSTIDTGMAYLRRTHSKYLPGMALATDQT